MDIRLSNRELTGPARTGGQDRRLRWLRVGRWTWIWLASIAFIVLLTGWLLYSTHREPETASLAPSAKQAVEGAAAAHIPASETAANEATANEATVGEASSAQQTASTAASRRDAALAKTGPADALAVIPPVEGLRLVRPSLRRGGLGSQALMTFTIRNSNDYPVKDIRLACTFSSRDGSYATERRHLIHGVVKANSRKVFRRLLMGFVSIGANQVKCAVLSADWA
jgi:hypothetical protein